MPLRDSTRCAPVSLIVLRFDYTSVFSIALLFGLVPFAAGFVEIGMTFLARGWWKLPTRHARMLQGRVGRARITRPRSHKRRSQSSL
jgi:hypothetical protein